MKEKQTEVKEDKKPAVKLTKKEEFIKFLYFLGFSCSAGAIQIGSFTLMNEVILWSYWPSYLISLTLSVLWNFTINRRFTFKAANNMTIAMLMVLGYYAVFTPISILWGNAWTLANGPWYRNEYLVLAVTMVINFVTEFLFCRYVVYGKSVNTRIAKKKEKKNKQEEEKVNEIKEEKKES